MARVPTRRLGTQGSCAAHRCFPTSVAAPTPFRRAASHITNTTNPTPKHPTRSRIPEHPDSSRLSIPPPFTTLCQTSETWAPLPSKLPLSRIAQAIAATRVVVHEERGNGTWRARRDHPDTGCPNLFERMWPWSGLVRSGGRDAGGLVTAARCAEGKEGAEAGRSGEGWGGRFRGERFHGEPFGVESFAGGEEEEAFSGESFHGNRPSYKAYSVGMVQSRAFDSCYPSAISFTPFIYASVAWNIQLEATCTPPPSESQHDTTSTVSALSNVRRLIVVANKCLDTKREELDILREAVAQRLNGRININDPESALTVPFLQEYMKEKQELSSHAASVAELERLVESAERCLQVEMQELDGFWMEMALLEDDGGEKINPTLRRCWI